MLAHLKNGAGKMLDQTASQFEVWGQHEHTET